MSRAESSGISLTVAEAAIVKGHAFERRSTARYRRMVRVNGGRVGDISTGKKFANVPAEAADKLPPPGPYLAGRDAHAAMIALEAAAETIDAALSLIREHVTTADAEASRAEG